MLIIGLSGYREHTIQETGKRPDTSVNPDAAEKLSRFAELAHSDSDARQTRLFVWWSGPLSRWQSASLWPERT